jgi:hypothetical protein
MRRPKSGERLRPEDLSAQIGVMVYEHPPVHGTAAGRHNAVSVVSWGPGRGGLWVHTWATASSSQQGIIRLGRLLARLPHEEVLARARTAAALDLPEPTPENKPSESEEIADQVADHILATFLPNLERAPVPPSFIPTHGYEWCGLTPMAFTEMEGGARTRGSAPTGLISISSSLRSAPVVMLSAPMLPPMSSTRVSDRPPVSTGACLAS